MVTEKGLRTGSILWVNNWLHGVDSTVSVSMTMGPSLKASSCSEETGSTSVSGQFVEESFKLEMMR